MRGTLTVCRRELTGLFLSPLAWILLLVALLLNGVLFTLYIQMSGGDVSDALEVEYGAGWPFWALIVFLPPLLAMRMLTEEARTGTLEFLLTSPVSDAAVVLGKFFAATAFMALLFASGLVYAATIATLGVAPDWGAVLGSYLGAVLCSALFVAISMLASTITTTPLIAAFLAFVANLCWLLLPTIGTLVLGQFRALLSQWAGSVELAEVWVGALLTRIDVMGHFRASFLRGVFDTSEVVFFMSWTAFFLFLTVRTLEMRRWRG